MVATDLVDAVADGQMPAQHTAPAALDLDGD